MIENSPTDENRTQRKQTRRRRELNMFKDNKVWNSTKITKGRERKLRKERKEREERKERTKMATEA